MRGFSTGVYFQQRKFNCAECQVEFKSTSPNAKRCVVCSHERSRRLARKFNQKYYAEKKEAKSC